MVPIPPRTLDIVASLGEARAKARQRALPGVHGPRNVEFTARKASMLRSWPCFRTSGRKRSTTSITLPNRAVRTASRSASLAAQANISSTDLGGRRTSNRPRARAGASAQAAISAMPDTASTPTCVGQVLEQAFGIAVEEERRLALCPDAGRLDLGLVDRAGVEAEVGEDLVGIGNWMDPASSNRKPSESSVVVAMPPMKWFFSRQSTRMPPRAMTAAAVRPLWPAPMTMAS